MPTNPRAPPGPAVDTLPRRFGSRSSLPCRRVAADGVRLAIAAVVGAHPDRRHPAVACPAQAELALAADQLAAERVRDLRARNVVDLRPQLLAPASRYAVADHARAATG